jgi:hypothetical protein
MTYDQSFLYRECHVFDNIANLNTKRVYPDGLSGPGGTNSGHSGLLFNIDGVGRQLGPVTFRTIFVRPSFVSSSEIGTLVGYIL